MAARFRLVVSTQEGTVLEREVISAVLPGVEGYFGVLAHHAPMVAALGCGVLSFRETEDSETRYEVEGGFVEVVDNTVTVLADRVGEMA